MDIKFEKNILPTELSLLSALGILYNTNTVFPNLLALLAAVGVLADQTDYVAWNDTKTNSTRFKVLGSATILVAELGPNGKLDKVYLTGEVHG